MLDTTIRMFIVGGGGTRMVNDGYKMIQGRGRTCESIITHLFYTVERPSMYIHKSASNYFMRVR